MLLCHTCQGKIAPTYNGHPDGLVYVVHNLNRIEDQEYIPLMIHRVCIANFKGPSYWLDTDIIVADPALTVNNILVSQIL